MLDPTPEALDAMLGIVRRAVHVAGVHARSGFRQRLSAGYTIEHKGAIEVVTRYDRETEDILRQTLGAGLPHIPIIGEERGGTEEGDSSSAALWVDPIDGTTNFVHGHPFWCISVGLALESAPILGVVLAPALGKEWLGWVSPAAPHHAVALRRECQMSLPLENDTPDPCIVETPCRVSTTARLDDALLATGFPYDRRTSAENNFDAFVALKQRCRGIRRCGSAALDLCLVADGTYDGYWERKLRPWDIVAGVAIVRAAGGLVSTFAGGSDVLETGRVVAAGRELHHELRTAIPA